MNIFSVFCKYFCFFNFCNSPDNLRISQGFSGALIVSSNCLDDLFSFILNLIFLLGSIVYILISAGDFFGLYCHFFLVWIQTNAFLESLMKFVILPYAFVISGMLLFKYHFMNGPDKSLLNNTKKVGNGYAYFCYYLKSDFILIDKQFFLN